MVEQRPNVTDNSKVPSSESNGKVIIIPESEWYYLVGFTLGPQYSTQICTHAKLLSRGIPDNSFALRYMLKAWKRKGLVEQSKDHRYKITSKGSDTLIDNIAIMDMVIKAVNHSDQLPEGLRHIQRMTDAYTKAQAIIAERQKGENNGKTQ